MTNAMEFATGVMYAVAFLAFACGAWANDVGRFMKAYHNHKQKKAAEEGIDKTGGLLSANLLMKTAGTRFGAAATSAWNALPSLFMKRWEQRKVSINSKSLDMSESLVRDSELSQ